MLPLPPLTPRRCVLWHNSLLVSHRFLRCWALAVFSVHLHFEVLTVFPGVLFFLLCFVPLFPIRCFYYFLLLRIPGTLSTFKMAGLKLRAIVREVNSSE